MFSNFDPAFLARLVVFGGLALGLLLGVVGQSTRFCVRGAVADWVVLRSPGRMVAWLLAIGVGAVAVQAMIGAGTFDAARTVPWGERLLWASALVGGTLFGFGMILAGGCPQRCLVKAGAGNLKAALVLLVAAIASAMTLRGLLAVPRTDLLDRWGVALGRPQDLGSVFGGWLGIAPHTLRLLLVALLLAAIGLVAWRMRHGVKRADWIGGVAVGLLLAAAFYLTGRIGFLAEHPETLESAWLGTQSRRPEGLSFSAPLAHALDLLTLWTDKSMAATFGVMLALGVLVGSAISARVRGEVKIEVFRSPREVGEHVAGALLMGFGGITALGCSIGNGVTGLALLSTGSALAVSGIVSGAWLALRVQQRRSGHQAAFAAATAA